MKKDMSKRWGATRFSQDCKYVNIPVPVPSLDVIDRVLLQRAHETDENIALPALGRALFEQFAKRPSKAILKRAAKIQEDRHKYRRGMPQYGKNEK